MKRALSVLVLAILTACTGGGPNPEPSGSPLPQVELQLRVLDRLPYPFAYCDPDVYPIGRGTPLSNAREHLVDMKKNRAMFDAILVHEDIPQDGTLSNGELLRVYADFKSVNAIELRPASGAFSFKVYVSDQKAGYDRIVTGSVTPHGNVDITEVGPANTKINCPICLARSDRIATPRGPVLVSQLRVGTPVWSTDRQGQRIRAVVLEVGRTRVPSWHEVVRLALANGKTVLVSPGHPTPNGRLVGSLRPGDQLGGVRVVSVIRERYSARFTYDVLPSGPTGTYFANGVRLGSTLRAS
jgi:hypothetical protein